MHPNVSEYNSKGLKSALYDLHKIAISTLLMHYHYFNYISKNLWY